LRFSAHAVSQERWSLAIDGPALLAILTGDMAAMTTARDTMLLVELLKKRFGALQTQAEAPAPPQQI